MGKLAFSRNYDSNYRLLQASDSADRLVKITYDEGQNKPKSITDCLGNEKQYTYDARGNIIRISDSLGSVERFWYDQNNQVTTYVDGLGRAEIYAYNLQGKLIRTYHAAQLTNEDEATGRGNFTFNFNNVTEYGYDNETGLLKHLKRGGLTVQTYEYNQDDMLIAVTSPAGYTLHRSYDERGRLHKVWDSDGEGFAYTYDTRDRIIRLSNQEGAVEYGYDDNGNLCSIKDACGSTTSYTFDSCANLVTIKDPLDNSTNYEYDENHNLKRVVLPNGSVRELEYDLLNRPKTEIW